MSMHARWQNLLLALGLLLSGAMTSSAQAPAPKRPNIVVILADDLGFSDLGCYGGEIQTPRLDQLAREGLRFAQFYNASKCGPSRASLLSGLYWQQAQNGIKRGITIGQALHAAGYTTLAAGKWHVDGNPVDRGFDHWFGFLNGMTNYFKGDDSFRLDHAVYPVPATNFYTTDAFTDYAISFVGSALKQAPDKPFFLYLAYNAPHDPLQAPAKDIARYQGKYAKGWDALRQARYARQIELGIIKPQWQLSPRTGDIPAWDTLSAPAHDLEASRMAVYAAMVDRMDQDIGRLLDSLRAWHVEDNTLVIFLSDNGGNPYDRTEDRSIPAGGPESTWSYGAGWANLSDTPFRLYKRNQHEGGIATPFIVRWPGHIQNAGAITDEPAHIIDIMATCVQLAGCDYQSVFGEVAAAAPRTGPSPGPAAAPPLAGLSLAPLFENKPWPGHDKLFFQLRDHRAIRAGDWKLASHDGGPWELYRMDLDRTEVFDLAHDQPNKVKELETLYNQWWNQDDIVKFTAHSPTPGYVDILKPTPSAMKDSPPANRTSDDD
jgi:arylsulfatase A-like enzyme